MSLSCAVSQLPTIYQLFKVCITQYTCLHRIGSQNKINEYTRGALSTNIAPPPFFFWLHCIVGHYSTHKCLLSCLN